MATITVEQFTDPFSPWCWAAQPTLRHLRYEFDDVDWTPRMTVFLVGSPPEFRPTRSGEASDDELLARWTEAAGATGMPVASDRWESGVPSSRPACAALAYVRASVPERALSALRQFQETVFAAGRPVEAPDDVASVAGAVEGVDEAAVRRALDDGTAEAALETDLERAVAVADELETVSVRGDVAVLPTGPRLPGPSPEHADVADGEAGTVDTERAGGPGGESESEPERDGGRDRGANPPDEPGATEGSERSTRSVMIGPPALRIESDAGRVVIADPRLPYGRLATAFGRSVPQTGVQIDDKYATSRMAMHIPREVAESLSAQDFAETILPYLERFGRAYLPEIVAGTGVSAETARKALGSLERRGSVERVGTAEWRTVDEAGRPRRDT